MSSQCIVQWGPFLYFIQLCQRPPNNCWLFCGREKCQSNKHNCALPISAVYILLRNHRELITNYKKRTALFFFLWKLFLCFLGSGNVTHKFCVTSISHTFLAFSQSEELGKNDKPTKIVEKNRLFGVCEIFFFFFFLFFRKNFEKKIYTEKKLWKNKPIMRETIFFFFFSQLKE